MLGAVRGEKQRLRAGCDVDGRRIGIGRNTMQQHLSNRHTQRRSARLARNHRFTPLRFEIRAQSFDLCGLADAVNAFE